MKKKEIVDYKEFLQLAKKNENHITTFKYFNGRLLEFKTGNFSYKYICETSVLTPNKFVEFLGFKNYSYFIHSKFSKLQDFAPTEEEVLKWWGGYFGGLINVNEEKINDYVGTGEVFKFYDYDINQAYLKELTNFLPTKFVTTISIEDFEDMKEVDKIPYFFFFEIELKEMKTEYFKLFGRIRKSCESFDFLNSKQQKNIIVSEKRLNLISQIYFKDFEIKKVFVFERHKYKFYENIVTEYLKIKNNYGKEFKENALRLYGTLGQIFKWKPTEIHFAKNGDLLCNSEKEINWKASPQIAMWVADCVAEKLFHIIFTNKDKIISWNTDGLVSTEKLNLRISKKLGDWKYKEINGTAFLFNENGARVFFKTTSGELLCTDSVVEKKNEFYLENIFHYSNLNKGYVEKKKLTKINKNNIFKSKETYRSLFLREKLKEIIYTKGVEI